jgi:predicted RNA-binding Zn-ribbon protein involved in translation (DUF1610 family)
MQFRVSPIGLTFNTRDGLHVVVECRLAMIVRCRRLDCGAILRTAQSASVFHTVVARDEMGMYFICPRCGTRNQLPERRSGRVAVQAVERRMSS